MYFYQPVMDGFEATKNIRRTSEVPIIALTAFDYSIIAEKFVLCGMDEYMQNPVRKNILEEKTKHAFEQAKVRMLSKADN